MKAICSTNGIVFPDFPNQGIIDISYSGFNDVLLYIEPSSSCDFEKKYINLIDKIKSNNINISACQIPSVKSFDDKASFLNILLKIMDICSKIGCKYLIIEPFSEENEELYYKLCDYAKENDIIILIENICREFNGHFVRGKWSDSIQIKRFIDIMNEHAEKEVFGCCLNIVNLNLCGQDISEFIQVTGKRAKIIIVSECDGHNQTYALPFTIPYNRISQTDWSRFFDGIRKSGFDGIIAVDIADTACAFPPLLRPSVMMLAKKTTEYFLWQLEMENTLKKYPNIVLFGAGNMLKNYMKCYGKKYPPKFTCDNNSKLWGQKIHGVEVKSPETLANIPENYCVFICNVYYRDIEKQLKKIGVKNIEYFNDEYLPISEE